VSLPSSESLAAVPLLAADAEAGTADAVEASVLALFDRSALGLLRYAASFGLGVEETEDVVQDVFLALFRHLSLGRDRTNLTGWLFRVTHNLALKRRQRIGRRAVAAGVLSPEIGPGVDPSPDPEVLLLTRERRRRLGAVFNALPDRERRCMFLRAEGLTYREIARTLRVSLGAVSKSLARALTRLTNADEG
jgi:RNA polymerase sigma-70 factor (ECF subfamily)